jgi:outer membrane protein assembly factor BamB
MHIGVFKKFFVFVIVFLFLGTGIFQISGGDLNINKNKIVLKEPSSFFDTDWPMFRHDLSHSGYTTSIAPNTNFILWNYTAGSSVHSSPTIANGKVYFGSMDHNIYCLDAATGVKIWQYNTSHPVSSSPAIYESMVYIGSNDAYGVNGNNLYCLDAANGNLIWEYSTGDSQWGIYSSPAVIDGMVYVGSGDHEVYCLNAYNGSVIWDFLTNGEVCSSPAIYDGKVYVGTYAGNVYCLNALTGSQIWIAPASGMIVSSPAVANDKVYIGSNKMYCFDAQTGQHIWDRDPIFKYSSPAVFENKVYICDIYETVYCFNGDNGIPIWQYETGGYESPLMWSSPAVADGKVYVGASDGKVYCLDAETGENIWDYFTNYYPIFSSPAIAYGGVFIGDMDGKVICFGNVNIPPYKPKIYGPDNGTINVEYTFCTDAITDPEGDSFYAFWDWGDGTNSGWLGPFASGQTICASHAWSEPGIYCIGLGLKNDDGMTEWSDPFCITITENRPPDEPIIIGPTFFGPGTHKWTFNAIDPDGDNVSYEIDWQDGGDVNWTDWFESGEEIVMSHTYSKKGTFLIKARAKDTNGAIGDWGFLRITIPRIALYNSILLKLLKQFPLILWIGHEIFQKKVYKEEYR